MELKCEKLPCKFIWKRFGQRVVIEFDLAAILGSNPIHLLSYPLQQWSLKFVNSLNP